MAWIKTYQNIRNNIIPGKTKIYKCDGIGRRLVVSNDGRSIGMETGNKTSQTKAISYAMIRNAYTILLRKGRFDSRDFRATYKSEYEAAPCRYSMVGGILVELGVARLIPVGTGRSCHYIKQ